MFEWHKVGLFSALFKKNVLAYKILEVRYLFGKFQAIVASIKEKNALGQNRTGIYSVEDKVCA